MKAAVGQIGTALLFAAVIFALSYRQDVLAVILGILFIAVLAWYLRKDHNG